MGMLMRHLRSLRQAERSQISCSNLGNFEIKKACERTLQGPRLESATCKRYSSVQVFHTLNVHKNETLRGPRTIDSRGCLAPVIIVHVEIILEVSMMKYGEDADDFH